MNYCIVTGELLEGNIPLYDGKVFELVKFQKEQVVGVILYEENPPSTSASAHTGYHKISCYAEYNVYSSLDYIFF